MFQFTWPLCTPPMFKFGPRGFQNWFYIHCSSNQKKVPSAQTFFAPNRSKLGKWTIQNHCVGPAALRFLAEGLASDATSGLHSENPLGYFQSTP